MQILNSNPYLLWVKIEQKAASGAPRFGGYIIQMYLYVGR
jgi:hypothetical protein